MADPIEGQPGITPPAPPAEGTPPPAADPFAAKLEGDKVPEKFRGKTLADVLESYSEAEKAKTKAEQESAQWRTYVANKLTDLEAHAAERSPPANPMDAFDTEQQKAINDVVGKGLQPIIDGLSSLMKEVVKSNRPDFEAVQEAATTYFNKMGPEYRVHPDYGWDYAYRMAKADQLKNTKSPPPPPQPGPTSTPPATGAPSLTTEEKEIAKRFNLTDEEYERFKLPVDVTTLKKEK